MNGQLKKRTALTASLLLALVAVSSIESDGPRRGSLISPTDYSRVTIWVAGPRVGDTAMFLLDAPPIVDGESIKISSVRVAKGSAALRFVAARVYEREDFNGSALMAWQSSNGAEYDPHRRPSMDLVGATFSSPPDIERFIMFEFAVCAPGELPVGEINVRYAHAGRTYHQVLKVRFEVRDAQPGTPCD